MSAEITQEQIDKIRKYGPVAIAGVYISDLLDALESSRAEVQRLREEVAQVKGAEERYRRVVALSDGARLDALWQELVAERDALKAEARRSDAGRVEVPEFDVNKLDLFEGSWSSHDLLVFIAGAKEGHRALASRLSPSPQPSADVVVVPRAEYRALESIRHHATEVAAGIREMGPSRLSEPLDHALVALDALRSSTNHDAQDAGEGR